MNKLPMTLERFEQMLKDYADFSTAAGVETYAEKAYREQLLAFARAAFAQQEAIDQELIDLRALQALGRNYRYSLHRQSNGWWIRIWGRVDLFDFDRPIDSDVQETLAKAAMDVAGKLPKETTV